MLDTNFYFSLKHFNNDNDDDNNDDVSINKIQNSNQGGYKTTNHAHIIM